MNRDVESRAKAQVNILYSIRKVYVDLYSAFFTRSASNALRHGSHSFTCKLHHACLYSPAAEHHRPLAGTHFTVPRRVEGCVDLGGWLYNSGPEFVCFFSPCLSVVWQCVHIYCSVLVNAQIPTPVHVNKTINFFVHPGICQCILLTSTQ